MLTIQIEHNETLINEFLETPKNCINLKSGKKREIKRLSYTGIRKDENFIGQTKKISRYDIYRVYHNDRMHKKHIDKIKTKGYDYKLFCNSF